MFTSCCPSLQFDQVEGAIGEEGQRKAGKEPLRKGKLHEADQALISSRE